MKPYRPSRFGQEAGAISPRISAVPSETAEIAAADAAGDNETIVFANDDGTETDNERRGLLSNKSFTRSAHPLSRLGGPSFNKIHLTSSEGDESSSSETRAAEAPKLPHPKQGALARVLAEDRIPRESRATEEEPDIEDTAVAKRIQQWWGNFDDTYMQPVFGGPKFKVSR